MGGRGRGGGKQVLLKQWYIYIRLHGVKTQTREKPMSIKTEAISFIGKISSNS